MDTADNVTRLLTSILWIADDARRGANDAFNLKRAHATICKLVRESGLGVPEPVYALD